MMCSRYVNLILYDDTIYKQKELTSLNKINFDYLNSEVSYDLCVLCIMFNVCTTYIMYNSGCFVIRLKYAVNFTKLVIQKFKR